MAFCPNCGNEITNSENRFCANCGYSLENNTLPGDYDEYNRPLSRTELASIYQQLYSFFSAKKSEYEEYYRLVNYDIPKAANTKHNLGLASAIMIPISGFFFMVTISPESTRPLGFVLLGFLLLGIFLLFLWWKKGDTIKKYRSRVQALDSELKEYYYTYDNCPVGMAYTSPEVLTDLYAIADSGRASSVKEVLNVFEQDLHNQRMLNYQAAQLDETRRASNNAADAAFFSALSFFF